MAVSILSPSADFDRKVYHGKVSDTPCAPHWRNRMQRGAKARVRTATQSMYPIA